jgi:hypothetical protein
MIRRLARSLARSLVIGHWSLKPCLLASCLLAGCAPLWPSDKGIDRICQVGELLIIACYPPVAFVWAAREGIDLAGIPRASKAEAPAVKGGLVQEGE